MAHAKRWTVCTRFGVGFQEVQNTMKSKTKRRDAIKTAMRDVEIALSQAIGMLHELDRARLHLRCLGTFHGGDKVIIPGNALALNAAVETAARSCRDIPQGDVK